MKSKTCTKCGDEHPPTTEYFYSDKWAKDGLRPECKKCFKRRMKTYYQRHGIICLQRMKKYQQTKKGKQVHQKSQRKYRQTFVGYLRYRFYLIKNRCNNPKCSVYYNYGGRGIECRFTVDEFVNYVTNNMNITDIGQIKGLDIDRIDNNSDYEPGNIRFVTHQENCLNRG